MRGVDLWFDGAAVVVEAEVPKGLVGPSLGRSLEGACHGEGCHGAARDDGLPHRGSPREDQQLVHRGRNLASIFRRRDLQSSVEFVFSVLECRFSSCATAYSLSVFFCTLDFTRFCRGMATVLAMRSVDLAAATATSSSSSIEEAFSNAATAIAALNLLAGGVRGS